MDENKGSSYRRRYDMEAGSSRSGELPDQEDDDDFTGPFDITTTKNASLESLKRWRQAALVLNACRRFRYTLDLKNETKRAVTRKIRSHAQAIRAANLFKEGAEQAIGVVSQEHPDVQHGNYGIEQEELCAMSKEHDLSALQRLGEANGLAEKLKSNVDKGIPGNDEDVLERKNLFGSNTYPQKKGKGFLRFVWEACQDLTLIILMVAAVASLALGIKSEGIKKGWRDGGSILFAVLLVIVVTAISDYRQSLQFQNLNEEKRNRHVEVIRGGRRTEVSIYDIVVGDVLPLKIGDQVPADGVLISGQALAIDESSMTGESKIVSKNHKSPFLLSGCKVADGYGTMLVTSVGINTEWGMLMASISEETGEETPLQVRLNGLATFVGITGLSVASVVLVVLLVRYFTGNTKETVEMPQFKAGVTSVSRAVDGVIKIITIAVTIVVVAVPEGLPLAVTLTLAYSMRKMMRDKALVRRLSACETMGSATTICSDKTGTLTLNQMTVTEAYVNGKKLDQTNDGSLLSPILSNLLIEGIAQNTTGSVFVSKGDGDVEISGSPTEKAILSWGVKLGMNFDAIRSKSTIIHAFPFNSEKKRGGVAVKTPKSYVQPSSEIHLHWKGAAEIVLSSCTSYMDESDSVASLDEHKVRMVTGDNLQTAKAIALECGILDSDADANEPYLIEGRVFRNKSEAEREEIAEKISVMGRSSPNDKLLLVQALKKKGHVVAVTGDGTNDAPALHESDIGLAMGIAGTEVAKESSDIIILDDNFASVVKVVRWGRSVFANIQKFIQFQLTVNVAALIINVVAAFSTGEVPLTAVQLLWVNLIMDTLGALALATEPPTDHLMRSPPIGRREPLITNIMWRNILIQAAYQVTVLLVLNFQGRNILHLQNDTHEHADRVKNSVIFNAFVLCQIFNEFNARKPDQFNVFEGVIKNYLFLGIVAITLVLQVIIIEFLGNFTSTVRLNWKFWLISIAIGFIGWPLAALGKLIPVPKTPLSNFFKFRRYLRRNRSSVTITQHTDGSAH
ncbi:calcium-transporting ATPase 8, plasma membrane-type-like isoform X3 [Silene latifolia]|uniref:calcium-transporting ATPase 8, plasma membrane-type-like isoform X3 n=1 Tax=Silene latifolia TaxID=37657 RepID=UPI003D76EE32